MKYREEKLIELIKDIYQIEDVSTDMCIRMEEILSDIHERETKCISLRYGLEDGNNMTYSSIGKVFNLSTERIRQIVKKGVKKLLHPKRREYVLTGARSLTHILKPNEYEEIQKNRALDFQVTRDTPIVYCPLSRLAINYLIRAGIYHVHDLEEYSADDLRVAMKSSHFCKEVVNFVESIDVIKFKESDYIKIIFSDIDGVLNVFGSPNIIEKDLVDRLKELKESTDSEVIIVSRLGDINRINMIESLGLKIYDSIIDIKPTESKVHAVVSYIKNNNVHVKNFVVFDDMDDGYSKHFFYHFIKVNSKKGLEEKDIDKAIAILNR